MPRKKGTRTRRRRTVSVNQLVSVKPTRRRRGTRKKGFLNDIVTPATTKGGLRAVGNGALGGALASVLERVMAGRLNPFWRIATPFAAGFAAAAFFKAPQIGAGIAAVGANQLMKEVGLADNDGMYLQDHDYANQIKQLPAALDGSGQPMGEDEMGYEEEEMGLQDADYQVGYAPSFGSPTVPVTVQDIRR